MEPWEDGGLQILAFTKSRARIVVVNAKKAESAMQHSDDDFGFIYGPRLFSGHSQQQNAKWIIQLLPLVLLSKLHRACLSHFGLHISWPQRMSFLGGAECSTAGNPLNQFTKHVQDDRSLQRDRLVGQGPGAIQESFRSQRNNGGQEEVGLS